MNMHNERGFLPVGLGGGTLAITLILTFGFSPAGGFFLSVTTRSRAASPFFFKFFFGNHLFAWHTVLRYYVSLWTLPHNVSVVPCRTGDELSSRLLRCRCYQRHRCARPHLRLMHKWSRYVAKHDISRVA